VVTSNRLIAVCLTGERSIRSRWEGVTIAIVSTVTPLRCKEFVAEILQKNDYLDRAACRDDGKNGSEYMSKLIKTRLKHKLNR